MVTKKAKILKITNRHKVKKIAAQKMKVKAKTNLAKMNLLKTTLLKMNQVKTTLLKMNLLKMLNN